LTATSGITAETLEILKGIPTQTLIDGLWVMGWPMSFIHGAKPLQPGQRMAGRAVTLRFVPHRPDLAADKPKGADSAEYVAFELCGPENVLVIDAMGWEYSSIGGDLKFMRLLQRVRLVGTGQLLAELLEGSYRLCLFLRQYLPGIRQGFLLGRMGGMGQKRGAGLRCVPTAPCRLRCRRQCPRRFRYGRCGLGLVPTAPLRAHGTRCWSRNMRQASVLRSG